MAGGGDSDSGAVARMRKRKPVPAPDFAGAGDAEEADGRPPRLPQPCPVTPVGVNGKNLIFLDGLQQQVIAAPKELEKGALKLWFGEGWLLAHYAEVNAKGEPNGKFNQDMVQTDLVEDCRNGGIFNPNGSIFGRGAHRHPTDREQLLLHMGRSVLIANAPDKHGSRAGAPVLRKAGRIGDEGGRQLFFPAHEALPPPAAEPSSAEEGRDLLHMLGKWFWVDMEASPILMLGMIGQMFFCGAQDWRAHMWLTAPTASGKTLLQKLIRLLHEGWCLFADDVSEAAIRQTLGDDTLPVLIDEAEADDNIERQANIVRLMKKSSAGSKIIRGGQDHKATEFTAQSCFLLSSVLHAPLKGEDRNRIAILELRQVPQVTARLKLDEPFWRAVGRRMHRRMIEQWPRFVDTLESYQDEIMRRGYESRWGDTYGTLLACADMLLYDEAPEDAHHLPLEHPDGIGRVAAMVSRVCRTIDQGRVEARSDVERVIVRLLSHQLPGAHGKPSEAVGAWVRRAMTLRAEPGQFSTDEPEMVVDREARDKLKNHGLRVVMLSEKDGKASISDARAEAWDESWLAVAYATNEPLKQIFKGSEWADGGWLQSLGKLEHARRPVKVRFAGGADNALLVPLRAVMGDEG